MNTRMTVTFRTTMMLLTLADSRIPRIRINDTTTTIATPGRLMRPAPWNGDVATLRGNVTPSVSSSAINVCDQLIATVAAPTAYSRMRSHPMIHAHSSPKLAYAYVYALPATG